MRAIRLLRIWSGLGYVIFALCAQTAFASIILRTPGNDSIATAQNLDGYFSRDFNPDIGNAPQGNPFVPSMNTSTTIPHATVLIPPSSPRPIPSFDFYSFTVPVGGGLTILDVDYGSGLGTPGAHCPSHFPDCADGIDTIMRLYNSSGAQIAIDDDDFSDPGAGGSFSSDDSFLQLFLSSGMYFVGISHFPTVPIVAGQSYALQVSVQGHAIPEPSPLLLIVLSIAILITLKTVQKLRRDCKHRNANMVQAPMPAHAACGQAASPLADVKISCATLRNLGRASGTNQGWQC